MIRWSDSYSTPIFDGFQPGPARPADPARLHPHRNLAVLRALHRWLGTVSIFDLQWLLYRPLYWFGNGAQPTVSNFVK
jgi:hypothetical protein